MVSIKNGTELTKSDNSTLYSVEGIACLLVITIHIGYPGTIGTIINVLARLAVPLFFIVSGFFLGTIDENTISRLNCKIYRILRLSLGATVLYWCWGAILHCFISQEISIFAWIKSMISIKNLIALIFMNSVPGGGHLWFLFALLYSYLVVKIIYYLGRYNWIRYFPVILLFTVLLPDIVVLYSRLTGKEINLPISLFRNWLFVGLPFVSIGIIINKSIDKIHRINSNIYIFICVLGLSLSYLERFLMQRNMDLYFGSIVSVVAVFLFSVVEPENRIFVLGHIGKKMSTTIYILHYVFVDIMWLVLSRTENTDKKIISWIAPIIVSALSILLAYILGCIENRRKELL